jgi:hypothetical protein
MPFEIHIATQQRQGPVIDTGEIPVIPMLDGFVLTLTIKGPNGTTKEIWVESTDPFYQSILQLKTTIEII